MVKKALKKLIVVRVKKMCDKSVYDDECNCNCHTNKDVMHCQPCCYTCGICKKNIKKYDFKNHTENCK